MNSLKSTTQATAKIDRENDVTTSIKRQLAVLVGSVRRSLVFASGGSSRKQFKEEEI